MTPTGKVAQGFEVVAVCGSLSPRGDASQDRGSTLRVEPAAAAVVVCDGVGALAESGDVAACVVGAIKRDAAEEGPSLDLAKLVERADDEVRRTLAGIEGATTAVAVLARGDGVVEWLVLGNGSVLEIAVVCDGDTPSRVLWGNHAVPETTVRHGGYAMASAIPASIAAPLRPTVGSLTLPAGTSRLILACSDGVLSEEETRTATAGDGVVWKDVPAPLVRLLTEVRRRWPALQTLPLTEVHAELDLLVTTALDSAQAAAELDDDATVGAVFIRPSAHGGLS